MKKEIIIPIVSISIDKNTVGGFVMRAVNHCRKQKSLLLSHGIPEFIRYIKNNENALILFTTIGGKYDTPINIIFNDFDEYSMTLYFDVVINDAVVSSFEYEIPPSLVYKINEATGGN